ncbi:MAG TPA: SBBP repeat-containing protein, partial [Candidatus Cybelea sp.]|nr:SBBP repeat-containing protein [Candidatus Cybelea sp.]
MTVYAPNATSVLRTISSVTPYGLAFDRSGNLYVANEPKNGSSNVRVYARGTPSVIRTITQGVTLPHTLALDAAGDLFVANAYEDVS